MAKVMCGRIADPNEPDGGGMDLMVHRYPPEKGGICECGLTFDDHIGSSDDPSENPPSGQ